MRGKFALVTKIIFLGITTAILALLTESAFAQKQYVIGSFILVAVLALNIFYLTSISVPFKFFLPGILFFLAFVIAPIFFTVQMSGYKYQTGNYLDKAAALEQVINLGAQPDAQGTTFDITVGKTPSNEYAILVSDITNNKYFISTKTQRIEVPKASAKFDANGVAIAAPNFKSMSASALSANDAYSRIRYMYEGKYYIAIESQTAGGVFRQELSYSAKTGILTNSVTGATYVDNHRGNFAKVGGSAAEILSPGWRAPIWFENYSRLVTDHKVRTPLIRVFIWTFVFALFSVLSTFAVGLLLAIALNRRMRGRRIYRSVLILPYAMPSIMSILIWAGMFDSDFGAVNSILHTNIHWFQNPSLARSVVLLVNLWLGFPYFYLICSGSLQAIPSELLEAASIDGANPRQVFRKITLPLLLQILSPLLIASFAFNFNNFNLIYLLTGGGPTQTLNGEIAGSTDILISYTYKIAFGTNFQDFGLASAISVIIFLIVASISMYGLRRSKVMETFG
jgi:arabinogalactan oligomer/maltooligosaccharide transport system permease protein